MSKQPIARGGSFFDPDDLITKVWYKPDMTKVDAEHLLMGGQFERKFVLRNSATKQGDYALTYLSNGQVFHTVIERHGQEFIASDSNGQKTAYPTVSSILKQFKFIDEGQTTNTTSPDQQRARGQVVLLPKIDAAGPQRMSYGSLNIIPAGMPGGLSSNPRNSMVTNYALPLSQASYLDKSNVSSQHSNYVIPSLNSSNSNPNSLQGQNNNNNQNPYKAMPVNGQPGPHPQANIIPDQTSSNESEYADVVDNPFNLMIEIIEARNLLPMDMTGQSDPFCTVTLNKDKKSSQTTSTQIQTLHPRWNDAFYFISREPQTDVLKLEFWDWDKFTPNEFLGKISIPVLGAQNASEGKLDQWFPLLDKKAQSKSETRKERGEAHIRITFGNKTSENMERHRKTLARWTTQATELTLNQELGRGAFGIVYRGKWRMQDVAVKVLLNQTMNAEQLDKFKQECSLMMNLRPHRNVVPLLGICLNPKLAIVTDFFPHGTVDKLTKGRGSISIRTVMQILKGIVAGMYHLHKEKILHRDLAARNVLLRADFDPVIADFGLSTKVTPINPDAVDMKTQETGKVFGPYRWMAPESLRNNEYSAKSDAYSFGVVMFEVLARMDPYPGMNIYAVAQQVVKAGLRPGIPPSAPPPLAHLMTVLYKHNPDDRWDFTEIGRYMDTHNDAILASNISF